MNLYTRATQLFQKASALDTSRKLLKNKAPTTLMNSRAGAAASGATMTTAPSTVNTSTDSTSKALGDRTNALALSSFRAKSPDTTSTLPSTRSDVKNNDGLLKRASELLQKIAIPRGLGAGGRKVSASFDRANAAIKESFKHKLGTPGARGLKNPGNTPLGPSENEATRARDAATGTVTHTSSQPSNRPIKKASTGGSVAKDEYEDKKDIAGDL